MSRSSLTLPEKRERGPPIVEGILPLAKSSFPSEAVFLRFGNKLWSGWSLPGHGSSYHDCGSWIKRGCLNVDGHVNHLSRSILVDGVDVAGKAYVKLAKRSCARFECPICHEKAFAKAAHRVEHRLKAFKLKGRELKVIHVVASPSRRDLYSSFDILRQKCRKVLKDAGVLGGCVVFHPWRKLTEDDDLEKNSGAWYLSPHFHVLGYGWITRVKEVYEANGWVIKNLGVRKSVNATAMYQLSHCGVHERRHSLTWFGALSYNKLHVPPLEDEKEVCPLCGQRLRLLMQIRYCEGLEEVEGDYYLDVDAFMYSPKSFG